MTATALVLFMTLPGLALFYGGLVHKKNVLSVLMHCFAMACILSVVWLVAGYSLALEGSGGWIGDLSAIFGKGLDGSDSGGSDIPGILTFAFQMTFFIITPALVVGTFVERVKFSAVMLFAVLWGLFCYAPICHMVWDSDGWMYQDGVIDLAGGIVVHITAGIAALIFCIMVGPRKETSPPHNLAMTVIGTCMLWVGWFGFNGGSALAANADAGMAILVTHISASVASMVWIAIEWMRFGKPSLVGVVTGAIAGLASITPASGFVGPLGAVLIGLISGYLCYEAVGLIKNLSLIHI